MEQSDDTKKKEQWLKRSTVNASITMPWTGRRLVVEPFPTRPWRKAVGAWPQSYTVCELMAIDRAKPPAPLGGGPDGSAPE